LCYPKLDREDIGGFELCQLARNALRIIDYNELKVILGGW